jgi:hypothetical protein
MCYQSDNKVVDNLVAAGTLVFICSPLDTPQGLGRGYFLSGGRHGV